MTLGGRGRVVTRNQAAFYGIAELRNVRKPY
jgi:hypothetical protein